MWIFKHLPWEAATFGRRSPLMVKATDDVDEDLAGSAGDSTADDDDELDDTELEHSEEDSGDDDGDADGKNDKAAEERRTRFASHEAAEEGYVELQSHTSRIEQENQALRRQLAEGRTVAPVQPVDDGLDEAAIARSIAEAVDQEVSALPKEQQGLRNTTLAIVKQVLKTVKPMTEKVADRVATDRATQAVSREQIVRDSEQMAKEALKAVGLSGPQHMDVLRMMIGKRKNDDPQAYHTWVTTTPAQAQFKELAQDAVKFVKSLGGTTRQELREANDRHRAEADGLESGSRSVATRTRRDQETEGDDAKGGTMLDALAADQSRLRTRGRHFATVAAGRR